MNLEKTKKYLLFGLIGVCAAAVVAVGSTVVSPSFANVLLNNNNQADYSLVLDSTNKVTSNGDKVQKTRLNNNVTFTYSGVNNSTSGHVTLNDEGTLVNKDWIRSITSFTCSFESAGTLKAKLSYGGDVWNDGFILESEREYELGSNPYFIKFISDGVTTINSITFKYSCLVNAEAHEGEEQGDGLLGVIDFWDSANAGDTGTSDLVDANYVDDHSYDSDGQGRQSKDLVSSVTKSYVYQDRYGGIGLSSGNNAASLALTLASGIEPISVVVIAGSQSPSKTLSLNDSGKTVSANCTGITALNDTYTNTLTWTFDDAPSTLTFTAAKSSKLAIYRIYLYGESGPTYNKPKDLIGFTVTDSKKDSYKMTDVFDTANGLSVVANYSDGTTSAISKGGVDGYSYVVEDTYGNAIDTSNDFGNIGGNNKKSYNVTVSYKSFIPQTYSITVSFVKKLTGIVLNSDVLEFNTAQKIEDYTENIYADLTYNKVDFNETDVYYSEFAAKGLTLTLLNPSGVTHPISTVFGTAGTWTLKLASNEDPTIYGTVELTVSAIPVETISVTGADHAVSLAEEATLQLTAAIVPDNATTQTIAWSSSDNNIATVNNNGLVTGVAAGSVRITATAQDGSQVYGYIDLTVTAKPAVTDHDATMVAGTNASDATISGNSGLKVGTGSSSGNLSITVPKDTSKISFYAAGWNNSSVTLTFSLTTGSASSVSLTADSGVSGNSPYTLSGNASTYYKEVNLSGVTAESTITISGNARFVIWNAKYYISQADPVYPTSISLNGTQSISVGGTSQLSVDYLPAGTNVKNVSFVSDKTNIATVSNTGLVTGVATGMARITATAETADSGTTTAYIDITVNAIAVSSVAMNKNATTVQVGGTEQLTATISPNNAGNKNVSWSTSNKDVATVSNTGLVTGVAAGNATITVTTQDGGKTATCAVTVVASGGSGNSGNATISLSDIPKTYNTSSGNTSADGFTFTVSNVASSYTSGTMQWKKSSGYIANTTPIEGLLNITIDAINGKDFSGTLYSGSTSNPSSNGQNVSSGNTYTFTGDPSYFKLEVGSTTGYTGDITVAYSTVPVDPTAITVSPSSTELAKGGSRDLSVTYTPGNANNNLDVTWSRYSGDSDISVNSTGTVTVSDSASVGDTAVIRATLDSNANIYSSCTVTVVEQKQDDQTILIYLCGSDLESNGQTSSSSASGYATGDIKEILSVSGQPDDVNVVIETGGAKCWKSTYGISKDYLTRYHVENKQLVKDSQETKANMGLTSTLQSFITWGLRTYPADRVSLILWNHGGAMRGVCYDENFGSDCLTNSEVKSAVANSFKAVGRSASDKLEWIGYDACLMQVQDIAEFNSEYFKYMVASEESEAGAGWDYDTWIDDAYAKKSTEVILTAIVDGFIADTNAQYQQHGWGASDQTLSWLNLANMPAYKSAWETMSSKLYSLISSYGKSNFQKLMKTAKYYGSDSDCEGYSYFGIFDAKDVLNKLKSVNAFSGASSEINAALTAFSNLVAYSKKGSGAGNSNGLCCFFPMKDGSGYTCSTSSVYTSSQTNFTNWRSIVTQFGD